MWAESSPVFRWGHWMSQKLNDSLSWLTTWFSLASMGSFLSFTQAQILYITCYFEHSKLCTVEICCCCWNAFLINLAMLYVIWMQISHFMLFDNDLFPTYFIFYKWSSSSKMGHKAAETMHRINKPFVLGTAMKESTGVAKKFWNRDKSPEAKRAQWMTIGTWQRPAESTDQSWSPYMYMGCCKELSMDHSKVIWNKFKRWKISVCVCGGVSHELTKNLYWTVVLNCWPFLCCITRKPISVRI